MAKSPEEMLKSMLENLPEKTGKTLADWKELLAKEGLTAHKDIMSFLKGTHGVTHGYANLISQMAREASAGGAPAAGGLIEAQYSGAKEHLRPIYEKLSAAVKGFGPDVELAPKKTYVSLRRNKQFGLIQPSTKTRVDVGINLKGRDPTPRLEESGSFNAMVSHRVRIAEPGEADEQVIEWLKEAYEAAG
ncbi:MAG: DUF5655 domain-containing protein [Gemmatimonadota bacterium]|jgi:hypothetical protein